MSPSPCIRNLKIFRHRKVLRRDFARKRLDSDTKSRHRQDTYVHDVAGISNLIGASACNVGTHRLQRLLGMNLRISELWRCLPKPATFVLPSRERIIWKRIYHRPLLKFLCYHCSGFGILFVLKQMENSATIRRQEDVRRIFWVAPIAVSYSHQCQHERLPTL